MAGFCTIRSGDCLASLVCEFWNDTDSECWIKTMGRYAYAQLNP